MNFQLLTFNFQLIEVKYKEQLEEKKEVKQVVGDAVKYKYKYNGKELQDELGLNWYDYGARNYQPDLGRWMSIDNLAEQYTAYSPYHYAGNNPIFNFDIDGNKFTEGAEKEAGKLVHKAVRSIYDLASTICKLEERIGNTDDEKKIKKLRKRIKGLESKISRFGNVISEINELRESDVLYDVQFSGEPLEVKEDGAIAYGETTYENGKVVMTVYDKKDGAYNLTSIIAHEFKHAFQFEKGYTDFDKKTGKGGLLWKLNRSGAEYQAYSRQKLFTRGAFHIPEFTRNIPLLKAVPSTMNSYYNRKGGNNEYIYRHNRTTVTWKR